MFKRSKKKFVSVANLNQLVEEADSLTYALSQGGANNRAAKAIREQEIIDKL